MQDIFNRATAVRVGRYEPPPSGDCLRSLMFEFAGMVEQKSTALSPVLSSAILRYRFEAITHFADGNGRTGRAMALWELYRRGFDTHHIFSVDEFYWENRPRYYEAADAVRRPGEDLTGWIQQAAEGVKPHSCARPSRVQKLSAQPGRQKLVLRSQTGAGIATSPAITKA